MALDKLGGRLDSWMQQAPDQGWMVERKRRLATLKDAGVSDHWAAQGEGGAVQHPTAGLSSAHVGWMADIPFSA